MRIAHERVYAVHVKRSPGRIFVSIADLPWVAIEADEHAIFAAWQRYEETRGQGFVWELDLGAETLTRRIVLPE